MDPTRFDTVIRTFGTHPSPTRRTVLATLAALAAVGGGYIPATEARGKRCRKKRGKLKCNGACIDPQTDVNNCGTCGNVCGQGQTCQGGTCIGGGGGGNPCDGVDCPANTVCRNGNCVAAPDRCGGPTGICNADPTPCGTSATGETCGCERTVEDNTFCANAGDNVCTGVECTSTQDCEDALGFHFFCQEAKTNAQGQFCGCGFGTATGRVCAPECDNPGGGGGGNPCDGVDCPANTVCENGNCVAAPDRCGGPTGICDADPTPCGTSATGETCGCERTVEGNTVCVDGANACPQVVECTSTQDCEDRLGFHFFCQDAKESVNFPGQFCGCGFGTATGKVCVAECDNPNRAVAQTRAHHGKARRRNRR